ncbi:MAG: hypothetical protein AAF269_13390 [Pseudomonadota bacterium]
MRKRIWIIVMGALIMATSSLAAYAFIERGHAKEATDARLDKLINESMCSSRR